MQIARVVLTAIVVIWIAAPLMAQTITTSDLSFAIPDYGGISVTTAGSSNGTSAGYATVQPDSGKTTPAGIAVVAYRTNNTLLGEFSMPAVPSLQNGRIYAEIGGAISTGIVFANTNNQTAVISFKFTDANGNDYGTNSYNLAANSQLAAFLTQVPFNSGNVQGTFTFSSNVPIAAFGLRLFTNERGDFLLSTLPVLDFTITPGTAPTVLAHFADGAGWTTQAVLVNPGDTTITGNVQFFNQSGQAVRLTANSQSVSTFPYSIPRAGSFTLLTAGAGANFVSGSIHVTPDMGSATPISQEIISFKSLGITATSFGSWSNAGTGLRMFVETAGSFGDVGSIQGGVAIANASSSATQVTVSLTDLNGGPQASTSVAIAANGQAAFFLRDLFPSLPAAFKGILRVTTSGSGLSVTGLRARFNGRGDFLFTSAAPVNESMSATSATTIVPHFLDGGGFTSEFNLFSGSAGQATSGHLRFYRGDASPLTLTLSGLPKKVKAQITSE